VLARRKTAPGPVLDAADEPHRERAAFHAPTAAHQLVGRRERRQVELVHPGRAPAPGAAVSIDYPLEKRGERACGRRTRDEPPIVVNERIGHEPRARGGEGGGERGEKDPIIPAAAKTRAILAAAVRDMEVLAGERTTTFGHRSLRGAI
jgi:hypothetical protein